MKTVYATLFATPFLLASCAINSTPNQAAVCPDCETVVFEDIDVSTGTNQPIYRTSHHCPGCQGALVTLFKNGKLEHRCSICNEKGFSCPINHPIKKSD
jgi:hypothetical protein